MRRIPTRTAKACKHAILMHCAIVYHTNSLPCNDETLNKVKTMALLNGRTPEELASEIVTEAIEPQMLEIDGVRSQELDSLARYISRDAIQVKGETWFNKNRDRLRQEAVEKLIHDKFDAIMKYMTKKEQDAKMQYFLLLRAKGMSLEQAEKESGINQVA